MTTWTEYARIFQTEEYAKRQLVKDLSNIILNHPRHTINIPQEILSKNISDISTILRNLDKKYTSTDILRLTNELVETFIIGSNGQDFFLNQLPEDKRKNLDDEIVTVEKLMDGNMVWTDKIYLPANHFNVYITGRSDIKQWTLELNNWIINFKNINDHELMYSDNPSFKI